MARSTPTIAIRPSAFGTLRKSHGLTGDHAFAKRIGVHQSTVMRVVDGTNQPGTAFIAAVLTTFEVPFEDLFMITSRS